MKMRPWISTEIYTTLRRFFLLDANGEFMVNSDKLLNFIHSIDSFYMRLMQFIYLYYYILVYITSSYI